MKQIASLALLLLYSSLVMSAVVNPLISPKLAASKAMPVPAVTQALQPIPMPSVEPTPLNKFSPASQQPRHPQQAIDQNDTTIPQELVSFEDNWQVIVINGYSAILRYKRITDGPTAQAPGQNLTSVRKLYIENGKKIDYKGNILDCEVKDKMVTLTFKNENEATIIFKGSVDYSSIKRITQVTKESPNSSYANSIAPSLNIGTTISSGGGNSTATTDTTTQNRAP